jgi:hypothetical protein
VGLIDGASFVTEKEGFDQARVDLFLDEIRTQCDQEGATDPWQPLRVAAWVEKGDLAAAAKAERGRALPIESEGALLLGVGGTIFHPGRRLKLPEGQVVARPSRGRLTLYGSDRQTVYRQRRVKQIYEVPPDVVDLSMHQMRGRYLKHDALHAWEWTEKKLAREVYELVEEATGQVVLWRIGQHRDEYDGGFIVFADRQWVRFPVLGGGTLSSRNHVMTALDQRGRRLVRYRLERLHETIRVNPTRQLDNSLLAAISITLGWLSNYNNPSGG